jgi:DNA-binding NarL/FixJ family response regulator
MIRVVIADDQVILRDSLKFIIEQDSEINVLGCVGNGREAHELCGRQQTDLVLMDIIMPVCDGIEGTRLIKSSYGNVKVLILTTFNDEENIANALKNGADGYVLKDVRPEELILAIKSVASGLGIIHRDAFNTVVKQFSTSSENNAVKACSVQVDLTEREKDIIRLIVDGKDNKEIASTLFIAEGSVKNVITGILSKLKLKDRTQLAVFAIKNNLV